MGQLPFNTFNPGPAYNGIGPAPIGFVGSGGTTVAARRRPAGLYRDTQSTRRFHSRAKPHHAIRTGLEPERRAADRQWCRAAGGIRRVEGTHLFRYLDMNQALPDGSLPFPDRGYVNQFRIDGKLELQLAASQLEVSDVASAQRATELHLGALHRQRQRWPGLCSQRERSLTTATTRPPSARIRISILGTASSSTGRTRFRRLHKAKALTSGWSLDGSLVWNTGQPVNVSWIDGYNFNFNGSGEYYGRPDLVGNPYAGTSAPYQFLNLSAFAVPCNGGSYDPNSGTGCDNGGHFGSLGRNAIQGPSYTNLDVSLTQDVQDQAKRWHCNSGRISSTS